MYNIRQRIHYVEYKLLKLPSVFNLDNVRCRFLLSSSSVISTTEYEQHCCRPHSALIQSANGSHMWHWRAFPHWIHSRRKCAPIPIEWWIRKRKRNVHKKKITVIQRRERGEEYSIEMSFLAPLYSLVAYCHGTLWVGGIGLRIILWILFLLCHPQRKMENYSIILNSLVGNWEINEHPEGRGNKIFLKQGKRDGDGDGVSLTRQMSVLWQLNDNSGFHRPWNIIMGTTTSRCLIFVKLILLRLLPLLY